MQVTMSESDKILHSIAFACVAMHSEILTRCSKLQYVATRDYVLRLEQCIRMCCRMLRCVGMCYDVLGCVSKCCCASQYFVMRCDVSRSEQRVKMCCYMSQYAAYYYAPFF